MLPLDRLGAIHFLPPESHEQIAAGIAPKSPSTTTSRNEACVMDAISMGSTSPVSTVRAYPAQQVAPTLIQNRSLVASDQSTTAASKAGTAPSTYASGGP